MSSITTAATVTTSTALSVVSTQTPLSPTACAIKAATAGALTSHNDVLIRLIDEYSREVIAALVWSLPIEEMPVFMTDFRMASFREIVDGVHDVKFQQLLAQFTKDRNRMALEQLGYAVLGGTKISGLVGSTCIEWKHFSAEELSAMLEKGFGALKKELKKKISECPELQRWLLREFPQLHQFSLEVAKQRRNEKRFSQTVTPISEILDMCLEGQSERTPYSNEETLIPIAHGGGVYHLIHFLRGVSLGYKLEDDGFGIQVSPYGGARSEHYARRIASAHFDRPCVLTAQIAAKYLDKAPNDYEAGLRPEFVKHLQNVQLTLCE